MADANYSPIGDLIAVQRELDAADERLRAHWARELQVAILVRDWQMVRLVYASMSRIEAPK